MHLAELREQSINAFLCTNGVRDIRDVDCAAFERSVVHDRELIGFLLTIHYYSSVHAIERGLRCFGVFELYPSNARSSRCIMSVDFRGGYFSELGELVMQIFHGVGRGYVLHKQIPLSLFVIRRLLIPR